MKKENMWECACGNIESEKEMPMECSQCLKPDGFTKVPQELAVEKKMSHVDDAKEDIDLEEEKPKLINKKEKISRRKK